MGLPVSKDFFRSLVTIKAAFSKLNINEDWARRRESALEGNKAAMALLILQKIVMSTFDEPHPLQFNMIASAFKRWEELAIGQEVHLWSNVRSYSQETSPMFSRETARCQALIDIRDVIKSYDDV